MHSKNILLSKKIMLPIAFILLLVLLFFLRGHITYIFNKVLLPGSVSKEKAVAKNCNGADTICTAREGKITQRVLTEKEIASEKLKYSDPREQKIQYASNVAKAVGAIREYTKIPDLDVSLVGTSPIFVSFYCNTENKCWAVNNENHEVIPNPQ